MTAGVPTEFIAPGPQSFETPPIIDGVDWFTKPVLVSALTVVVIVWFYWGASRKAAIIPSSSPMKGSVVTFAGTWASAVCVSAKSRGPRPWTTYTW